MSKSVNTAVAAVILSSLAGCATGPQKPDNAGATAAAAPAAAASAPSAIGALWDRTRVAATGFAASATAALTSGKKEEPAAEVSPITAANPACGLAGLTVVTPKAYAALTAKNAPNVDIYRAFMKLNAPAAQWQVVAPTEKVVNGKTVTGKQTLYIVPDIKPKKEEKPSAAMAAAQRYGGQLLKNEGLDGLKDVANEASKLAAFGKQAMFGQQLAAANACRDGVKNGKLAKYTFDAPTPGK